MMNEMLKSMFKHKGLWQKLNLLLIFGVLLNLFIVNNISAVGETDFYKYQKSERTVSPRTGEDCTLEITNVTLNSRSSYSFDIYITRNDPPWSSNTALGSLYGFLNSTLVFNIPNEAFSNPQSSNLGECISETIPQILGNTLLQIELISSGIAVQTTSTRLLTITMEIDSASVGLGWSAANTVIYMSDNLSSATLELLGSDPPHSILIADFSASDTTGLAPLSVNFIDESNGNIDIWEWDFQNDGEIDSYEQNPSYTYSNNGSYSVSLTITDENDSTVTKEKNNFITVYSNVFPAPPANITIQLNGLDATINWASVDTTIYGNPISVDGYVIYSSNLPDSAFTILTSTADTFYVDTNVSSSKIFYKITAYVGELSDFQKIISEHPDLKMGDVERLPDRR
ncbi:MAG: PKD domain-containing protein [Candidatus Cloacimonadota bacterium]|nr:PKD domain-containing protein [Candidatus Cloacimonadota bacterium]